MSTSSITRRRVRRNRFVCHKVRTARRSASSLAVELGRGQRQPVAFGQQVGDLHLAVDHALAPHFGRMCGQHRHDQGTDEERPRRRAGVMPASRARASAWVMVPSRGAEAARCMGTGAADVVLVLGDIGEMRKKAEGANDLKRLGRRQAVQCRFEIAPRRDILVAAKANRVLANMLDGVEDSLAALLAHRVAENAAEQPDIVAQRQVFVFGLDSVRFRHGLPFSARRRKAEIWPSLRAARRSPPASPFALRVR